MTAGATLKRVRVAAHVTQQELAEMLDVSLSMVSKWERDDHVPRREMAERIDTALKAGGELFVAFGYTVNQPDRIEQLEALVTAQGRALEELSARVVEMGAELERLRRRSRPGSAASG